MLVARYSMTDFCFSGAHHSSDTCKNQRVNSLEFLAILSLCCSLLEQTRSGKSKTNRMPGDDFGDN